MAKFEGIRGVTYEVRDGRYRLLWRQNETQGDGSVKRVARRQSVDTFREAVALALEIRSALDDQGFWEPETAPAKPPEINLERAALRWLTWKRGVRQIKGETPGNLRRCMKRSFGALRAALGRPPTETVWASDLSIATVGEAALALREGVPALNGGKGYSEGTVYQTLAAFIDMWRWLKDAEPAAAVPPPPYNPQMVLPPSPVYEAPSDVASWAECDAVIRNITNDRARCAAIIMRYTGLRIAQACYVHREDFDPARQTLLIRKGKSRREAALMRRVPVSPHLFADLGPLLHATPRGPLFPDPVKVDGDGVPLPMASPRNLTRYVSQAWQLATEQGLARTEVWQPPNRKKNRPDHAFRAAFQSGLQEKGVGDAAIDWLVGHAAKNTRGQHYTPPSQSILRRAVETLSPIDWAEDGVVVALRHG